MNRFVKNIILSIQKSHISIDIDRLSFDLVLDQYPPVFILSAPRSGSTVFFQSLISNLNFCYLSNIMSIWPSRIDLIAAYFKHRHDLYISNGVSEYGYSSGLFEPNEGGSLYQYWLSNGPKELNQFFLTINLLSSIFSKPFLTKNTYNVYRTESIQSVIPNARFIILSRNPLSIMKSIYLTRRMINKDMMTWWGVKVEKWEEYTNKSPEEQIAWQVFCIQRRLDKLSYLDATIKVEFESFCSDEELCIRNISDYLNVSRKPFIPMVKKKNSIVAPPDNYITPETESRLLGFYEEFNASNH